MRTILTLSLIYISCLGALPTQAQPPKELKKAQQPLEHPQQKLIHINTATAKELEKELQGIGKSKAQAIVRYRETHGLFSSIQDLQHIQGIGKALIDRNREKMQL